MVSPNARTPTDSIKQRILDRSDSRLGFGELSTPTIARYVGRLEFFSAIERAAPTALAELRSDVLPLYAAAMKNSPPKNGDVPSVIVETLDDDYLVSECHTVGSWQALLSKQAYRADLTALFHAITRWADRYRIRDAWLLECVFRNLVGWHKGDSEWGYPGSVGFSQGVFLVSGIEGDQHGVRDLQPPPKPIYNPLTETREQYLARMAKYCAEQEGKLEKLLPDVRPTESIRVREHYDWLVQFQIRDQNYRQIAVSTKRHVLWAAIRAAVNEKADIIGLTLRPARRGRPPIQKKHRKSSQST